MRKSVSLGKHARLLLLHMAIGVFLTIAIPLAYCCFNEIRLIPSIPNGSWFMGYLVNANDGVTSKPPLPKYFTYPPSDPTGYNVRVVGSGVVTGISIYPVSEIDLTILSAPSRTSNNHIRGIPAWARDGTELRSSVSRQVVGAGFPLRCFSHYEVQSANVGAIRRGMWPVLGALVPVLPYWPSISINILLLGLMSLVANVSLVAFWRWHPIQQDRLRRGLCPHCAYDLKSQPTPGCPECGWLRAAGITTPPPSPPTAHDPATGPRS